MLDLLFFAPQDQGCHECPPEQYGPPPHKRVPPVRGAREILEGAPGTRRERPWWHLGVQMWDL